MEVGVVDAWRMWLDGVKTEDLVLWNVQILWWARFGKLLQFLAIATVIAELVGTERLKALGRLVSRSPVRMETIRKLWSTANSSTRTYLGRERPGDAARASSWFPVIGTLLVILPFIFLATFPPIVAAEAWLHDLPWWLELPVRYIGGTVGFIALCYVLFYAVPVVFVALTWILTLPGVLFDVIVIRPLVAAFSHEKSIRYITLTSVIVTGVGFHFDLLGS